MGSMTTVTGLVSSVFDMMTSNPLLTTFLAAGLIGVGIGVFRSIKGATRGK